MLKQARLAELRLHSVALNAAKLKNDELLSHLIMPLYYPAIYHFDSRNNLLERNRSSRYPLYLLRSPPSRGIKNIAGALFVHYFRLMKEAGVERFEQSSGLIEIDSRH